LVTCSASSCGDVDWAAQNAAAPSNDRFFCSENKPDQWICYDLGKLMVNPTGYMLKTAPGCGNPREWVIEASKEGKSWAKLSDGGNERDTAVSQKFSMSKWSFVRMIRLRHTGKKHIEEHQLGISFFDVLGPTAYEVAAAVTPKGLDLEQDLQ
jgi:hypothetical protein